MNNNLPKYLLIFFSIFQSCNSNQLSDLQTKILELEVENQTLKDSIAEIEYQRIIETAIIGSINKPYAKVKEEVIINLQFCNQDFYSTYEMFKIDPLSKKRELLNSSTGGKFEYAFTPNSIDDHRLQFVAVFELDSTTIEIPADFSIQVKQ